MRYVIILGAMLFCIRSFGSEFDIVLENIPRPVSINFPEGFHLANSDSSLERRERFLNYYQGNPSLRGQYSEILLIDWESSNRLPQIVVGTLGATAKLQGRISRDSWLSIREEFKNATVSQVQEIRATWKPNIENNSPVSMEIEEELIWFGNQTDPNSITILTHMRSEIEGKKETVFSARKIMYFKGFMVFSNVIVDSSQSSSLKKLKSYLEEIVIKGI